MNQSRIVIVNVWHDDNKGDGGICEGLINLLKQSFPEAKLGIVNFYFYKIYIWKLFSYG